MGQFGEISEGIVGQHPDLIVAQIPERKKGREILKSFFPLFPHLGGNVSSHVYFIYSLVRILRWFSLSGWIVLMSFTSKYSSVVSGGIPRGISVS